MSLIIAGSIVGGIILYNNSDDIMIETLRMYTNIQEYFNKKGFFKQNQQDTFNIGKNKINKYISNNKEFYTLNNNNKPSENMLNEYSLQLNPILSISLKINNSNYEVTIIPQFLFIDKNIELNQNTNEMWIQIIKYFQNIEIIYDKNDDISWEILDSEFNTINGKNITLSFNDQQLKMIKN